MFFSDQHLNEELEKERVTTDDLRETCEISKKQIEKLEKILQAAEKENDALKAKLLSAENEKVKLEKKIENFTEKHLSCIQDLAKLQTEVTIKEQEMLSLEEDNLKLKEKLSDLEHSAEYYRNETEVCIAFTSNVQHTLLMVPFVSKCDYVL